MVLLQEMHCTRMGKDTMPEWDTCRPGFSALTAGLLRAIDVETSIQVGEVVVANLCDMTKLTDNIDL